LDLAETDGAELQIRITSLLSQMPSPDFGQLQDFGARLAKVDAVMHFETVADLLRRLLSRLIRHASGSDIGLKPDEAELFSRLTASAGLDRWLQVWEKTDDLLSRTNRINLDRKHVILNVFLKIAEAARGG
jgi:DNA polymerase-3 subunit delta'